MGRYHPSMKTYLMGWSCMQSKINKIYLDTTYAHPTHKFMPQEKSISIIIEDIQAFFENNPDGLILVSAYTIGSADFYDRNASLVSLA